MHGFHFDSANASKQRFHTIITGFFVFSQGYPANICAMTWNAGYETLKQYQKNMKKTLILAAVLMSISAMAQTPENVKYEFTEASELNLIGKILPDTPNPYHRVDTCKYKGFTKGENEQVRCSAGLAVIFKTNKTNSSTISVKSEFGYYNTAPNTMGIALRGYDLYIMKDGVWTYAASKTADPKSDKTLVLISDMDHSEKECMLYLPIYSEMYSVKIGIEASAPAILRE